MAILSTASYHREPKYTQGFVFEQGRVDADYLRAVVERSCAAIETLLQDTYASAEKHALQLAMEESAVPEQNRAFRRMADIIQGRQLLERAVLTAVVCAFGRMTLADNHVAIDSRLVALEKMVSDRLDLQNLLRMDAVVRTATDRCSPVLLSLSEQLAGLFGIEKREFACNPLAPVTLAAGFVVGLMCTEMDVVAKYFLFAAFEQEFLAKLPLLLNSVMTRLQSEYPLPASAGGYDEPDPGPISRVLASSQVMPMEKFREELDYFAANLSGHSACPDAGRLQKLARSGDTLHIVQLMSDLRYLFHRIEVITLRSRLNETETLALAGVRHAIADCLNPAFSGCRMPRALKMFFTDIWPEILFDIYVISGDNSEAWQEAMVLQRDLLRTVTPVSGKEDGVALGRLIPQVIRQVRERLDETGFHYAETAAFLAELKRLHLKNLQHTLEATDTVTWDAVDLRMFTPRPATITTNPDEVACLRVIHDAAMRLVYC